MVVHNHPSGDPTPKATANTQRAIDFDRERLEFVSGYFGEVELSAIAVATLASRGLRCGLAAPGRPHG